MEKDKDELGKGLKDTEIKRKTNIKNATAQREGDQPIEKDEILQADEVRDQQSAQQGAAAAPDRGTQRQDVRAGKGRRDEVGRSGIYPASGPLPEGDVELREQGTFGHRERKR